MNDESTTELHEKLIKARVPILLDVIAREGYELSTFVLYSILDTFSPSNPTALRVIYENRSLVSGRAEFGYSVLFWGMNAVAIKNVDDFHEVVHTYYRAIWELDYYRGLLDAT